jgi:hypothetical protein
LNARNAPFAEEKSVKSPEYQLDPAAWEFPGEFSAMKNCVCCNGRLAILSSDDNVPFIALLSPFGRMQRLVCGGKVSQIT